MKKRKITSILAAVMMSLTLASCGAEPPPMLTAESEATLKAVFMLPAERIPEGGWTEDSFPYVLYIAGRQRFFPTTLAQCSSLFSVAEDDAFSFADDGVVAGHLLFQGCYVGTVKLSDAVSESKLDTATLRNMTFTAPKSGDGHVYPSVYPISLNHVTIGSTAEDIETYLGFPVKGEVNFESSQKIGRYQITIKGTQADGVTFISVSDNGT